MLQINTNMITEPTTPTQKALPQHSADFSSIGEILESYPESSSDSDSMSSPTRPTVIRMEGFFPYYHIDTPRCQITKSRGNHYNHYTVADEQQEEQEQEQSFEMSSYISHSERRSSIATITTDSEDESYAQHKVISQKTKSSDRQTPSWIGQRKSLRNRGFVFVVSTVLARFS